MGLRAFGAALCAIGLVATGCSSPGPKDQPTKVTVLSWRPEDAKGYARIFAQYERVHPKVRVVVRTFSVNDYAGALGEELGKDRGGPDIVQLKPYGGLEAIADGSELVPLDGKVDFSAFPPSVFQGARGTDGKLYGVPFALQTAHVLYNKKIFARYGLKEPKTWRDMLALCEKLKRAGIVPFATSGMRPWVLSLDLQILGATRFGGPGFGSAVRSGKTSFTDPDYVASLDLIGQLAQYFPKDVTTVDYPAAQALFTGGEAAMFPGGSFEVGTFRQMAPGLDLGFFDAPPAPGAKVKHALATGWMDGSYGVNAQAPHPARALDLVRWMATPEFGRLYASELHQIPAVRDASPADPLTAAMLRDYQTRGTPYTMLVDFSYGDMIGRDSVGFALQTMLRTKGPATEAAKRIQKDLASSIRPQRG